MHADAPEERPKGGERSSTTWCPNDGCAPPGARGSDSDCSQPCLRLRAPDVPPWQATKHLDAEVARRYLPREVFFTFVFAFFAGFASLPSGDGVALTFFFAGMFSTPFVAVHGSWIVPGSRSADGHTWVALPGPPQQELAHNLAGSCTPANDFEPETHDLSTRHCDDGFVAWCFWNAPPCTAVRAAARADCGPDRGRSRPSPEHHVSCGTAGSLHTSLLVN
jgi:hypothetical protein